MPSPVPVLEAEAGAVRRQLEEVLKSPGFARNERLTRFLHFVVDRHIEGRSQDLKESVIGVEVFGREPAYDTRADPIVRTEARRLRARLKEYYDGPGAGDTLVINVPKGGYVPVIRLAAHVLQGTVSRPQNSPRWLGTWHLLRLALVAVGVIISVIGVMRLVNRGDALFCPIVAQPSPRLTIFSAAPAPPRCGQRRGAWRLPSTSSSK